MNWKQFFTSSIGKKFIVAFTGIFLILFLIIHCAVNACIFVPDHGKTFLIVAHFMSSNWIIHILEIGLFAGLILHIVQALVLVFQNKSKRKIAYAVPRSTPKSTWYSRSMGLLGTLILIFLIIHLGNFWVPNRYNQIILNHELNMFERMQMVFSNPWIVIIYLLGLISLCYHLLHGFQSSFRTLGMNSKKYIPIVKGIGIAFSILICVLFALMPVLMYFNVVR